jgi:hypothetical protein
MPSPCTQSPVCQGSDNDINYSKEIDDVVLEVDCKMVTSKAGVDVDIGVFGLSEDSVIHIAFRREPIRGGARRCTGRRFYTDQQCS